MAVSNIFAEVKKTNRKFEVYKNISKADPSVKLGILNTSFQSIQESLSSAHYLAKESAWDEVVGELFNVAFITLSTLDGFGVDNKKLLENLLDVLNNKEPVKIDVGLLNSIKYE